MIKSIVTLYKNIIGKPFCLWQRRDFETELTEIPALDVELAGHCNLNCKCCTHFSPLAEKEEIPPKRLKQDLIQLKKVLGEKVHRINLLGGEPLLHSGICECMETVREIFPAPEIVIVTNGILLAEKDAPFWRTVREMRIKIEVTKYPVSLDYRRMKKMARENGVSFRFYGRSGFVQKTQYYLPLDREGRQNKEESYRSCFMARNCFTLREGRIYPCSYAAFIGRFNTAFGEDIPDSPDNYGDLYRETQEQIMEKLGKAIPMCSYCDVGRRIYGNAWGISKRTIDEWS